MRASHSANNVVRVIDIGYPIAHSLVHSVLKCFRARRHRYDVGTHQFHAIYVQTLAMNIFFAHVNITRQTQSGGYRRCRNTVLTSSGLRDDTRLTHALSQQSLADGIANLVRAGVIKVFAL